jgi:hypothetical protein
MTSEHPGSRDIVAKPWAIRRVTKILRRHDQKRLNERDARTRPTKAGETRSIKNRLMVKNLLLETHAVRRNGSPAKDIRPSQESSKRHQRAHHDTRDSSSGHQWLSSQLTERITDLLGQRSHYVATFSRKSLVVTNQASDRRL